MEMVRQGLLLLFLAGAVVQDIKDRKIKNIWNGAGTAIGLLSAVFFPPPAFWEALAGMAGAFVLSFLCWRIRAFQAGDAKLFCALGAFLGWNSFFSCFLESILLGAVVGLLFLAYRAWKKKEDARFPFSVVIAAACMATLKFGYIWEII